MQDDTHSIELRDNNAPQTPTRQTKYYEPDDEDNDSMVNNLVKRRREELMQSPPSPPMKPEDSPAPNSKFLPASNNNGNFISKFLSSKSNRTKVIIIAVIVIIVIVCTFALFAILLQNRSSPPPPTPGPTPVDPSAPGKKYSVQNHTTTILSFGKRSLTTPGHTRTREYITSILKEFNWTVTLHESQYNNVPVFQNPVTFRNIIGSFKLPRKNSSIAATKSLVLACHYDSKYFTNIEFLGATDSAVPCAMMLDMAEEIAKNTDDSFTVKGTSRLNIGEVQLIFFDGEEAIVDWSDTDSIYGARALAQTWQTENKLSSISLFVLLDLIGEAYPQFVNYQMHFTLGTNSYYEMFADSESELNTGTRYFSRPMSYTNVQDDHIPFLQRGVPIVHLITSPFPSVWHNAGDNLNAVHFPTVNTLQAILKRTVAKYVQV